MVARQAEAVSGTVSVGSVEVVNEALPRGGPELEVALLGEARGEALGVGPCEARGGTRGEQALWGQARGGQARGEARSEARSEAREDARRFQARPMVASAAAFARKAPKSLALSDPKSVTRPVGMQGKGLRRDGQGLPRNKPQWLR